VSLRVTNSKTAHDRALETNDEPLHQR
jgi:hypothetical protein